MMAGSIGRLVLPAFLNPAPGIDTAAIRERVNLLALVEADTSLRQAAATQGGEYVGACPFCGGTDRFRVQPEQRRWWCRQCAPDQHWSDCIAYVQKKRDLRFTDACVWLETFAGSANRVLAPASPNRPIAPTGHARPSPSRPTAVTWSAGAELVVRNAELVLEMLLDGIPAPGIGPQDVQAVPEFITQRGLTRETIKRWRLGWQPRDRTLDGGAWGWPGLQVKVPRGLVIPTIAGGQIVAIKVRRPTGNPRYQLVVGSQPALFGADLLDGRNLVLLVESELDAILMHQDAGDLLTTVALGQAKGSLDVPTKTSLLGMRRILIGFDQDDAGRVGAQRLLTTSARMRIVKVPGGFKDPGELRQNGWRLRDWAALLAVQQGSKVPTVRPAPAPANETPTSETPKVAAEHCSLCKQPSPRSLSPCLACRAAETVPSVEPEADVPGTPTVEVQWSPPPYELVTEPSRVRELTPLLLAESALGVDIETYGDGPKGGLDPLTGHIRLVQLGTRDRAYVFDLHKLDGRTLVPIFVGSPRLIAHNAKFEAEWLWQAGLLELDGRRLACTQIAVELLEAGRLLKTIGGASLEKVARYYLGTELDKTAQTSNWGATLSAAQYRYAATDAVIMVPLFDRLHTELAAEGLTDIYEVEMAALSTIAWLELVGAPFDATAWRALAQAALPERERLRAEMAALTGTLDMFGGETVNWSSKPQALAVLRRRGLAVDSVKTEALVPLVEQDPLIPLLIRYIDLDKMLTGFGLEYVDRHVHGKTGRIHGELVQLGSRAGRMSARNPNLQQVPHDRAYRSCFRAGPGRAIVKADLSLVELVAAAQITQDRAMISALTEGRDLHRLTAAALFQKTVEQVTLDERAFGKQVNFGTLYGQGLTGLMKTATEHGLQLGEAEAKEFQARFNQAWPDLYRWRTRVMREHSRRIRTLSGRQRWVVLPDGTEEPGTARANTPVQGLAADCFKVALGELWQTRSRCPSAVPILAVHDELVMECDEAAASDVAAWVTECLQAGMRRYVDIPVRVETTIGRDWAGTELCPPSHGSLLAPASA
jgi:DNA polymerase I-like protein with 3'-5' exonuclease and polymerase domains